MVNKKKKTGKGRLDKFYYLAKDLGYRSRAAFKLIQLNKKYGFLDHARVIIDLCAAPGSWLQVCLKYMPVSSSRLLVGVDLDPIRGIPNVHSIVGDITTPKCHSEIKRYLGLTPADVVLHDGAPNVGGAWAQDAFSQSTLVLSALKLATGFLKTGGIFVTKIFRSADYNSLMWVFNRLFKKVTATKPSASRLTSAEIFVVCEGYLHPDQVDPRLLDSRHVFKELSEEAPVDDDDDHDHDVGGNRAAVDIFAPHKKKHRHRTGYDTTSMLLYNECSIIDFIESSNPVKLLGQFNCVKFSPVHDGDDAEEINLIKKHPLTTDEIMECFSDLKLLHAKEFRKLLKWRSKMITFMEEAARKNQDSGDIVDVEEIKLTEEEKDNLLQQEMEDKLKKRNRQQKNKIRKKNRKEQEQKIRMGLSLNVASEDLYDAPQEGSMFRLKSVKDETLLSKLEQADDSVFEEATKEKVVEKQVIEFEGSDDEDYIGVPRDDLVEKDIKTALRKRNKLLKQKLLAEEKPDPLYNSIYKNDELGTSSEEESFSEENLVDSDDISQNEEVVGVSEWKKVEKKAKKSDSSVLLVDRIDTGPSKTKLWFEQDLFEGVDDDLDEETAVKSMFQEQMNRISQQHNETEMEDVESKSGGEKIDVSNKRKRKNDEDSRKKSKKRKQETVAVEESTDENVEDDNFEVVPKEPNVLDFDDDERAEILALGKAMQDPTRRAEVVNSSINRYAYNDRGSSLPEWFVNDESRHNRPIIPITKEEVAEQKRALKDLNARDPKKVMEAKFRNKQRMVAKLNKAKAKASAVSANTELSERDKIKQIQKLYKGTMGKTKTNKVYVVGKKFTGNKLPKGNLRIKLVDRRMKADKRGAKAKERRSKAKSKKRNKKRN